MKVIEVDLDFVLNHPYGDYNPTEWKNIVNRHLKYENVKWYVGYEQQNVDDNPTPDVMKDTILAEYTIPEGLRFLQKVSFTSVISNGGFVRANVLNGEVVVKGFGIRGTDRVSNTIQGRKWLVENICKFGVSVSSAF